MSNFIEELDSVNKDPVFRFMISKEEDEEKIFNSKIRLAEENGLRNGMKKGLEKGINHEKLEIAKKMLQKKMNIQDIINITDLKENEINKLKEN